MNDAENTDAITYTAEDYNVGWNDMEYYFL